MSDRDLVIDVDIKNGSNGLQSWDKLKMDAEIFTPPTVITQSGGFHIYLRKSPDIKVRRNNEKYPGIDFLSKGSQCVIAGTSTNVGTYELLNEDGLRNPPFAK